MSLTLDEFRQALGADGRKLSDAELRQAKVECEALARIVFEQLTGERRKDAKAA